MKNDCAPHCCCCGIGEPCCDCGEVPVRPYEVLRYIDEFAGQENTAEEVRDWVQLAARGAIEGLTRKDFRDTGDAGLIGFVEWCEEQDA
jgi:hypothetical protein